MEGPELEQTIDQEDIPITLDQQIDELIDYINDLEIFQTLGNPYLFKSLLGLLFLLKSNDFSSTSHNYDQELDDARWYIDNIYNIRQQRKSEMVSYNIEEDESQLRLIQWHNKIFNYIQSQRKYNKIEYVYADEILLGLYEKFILAQYSNINPETEIDEFKPPVIEVIPYEINYAPSSYDSFRALGSQKFYERIIESGSGKRSTDTLNMSFIPLPYEKIPYYIDYYMSQQLDVEQTLLNYIKYIIAITCIFRQPARQLSIEKYRFLTGLDTTILFDVLVKTKIRQVVLFKILNDNQY